MLVQAAEMNYDYNNNRIAAVGSVRIHWNGSTLEADKVIYDQKTKRLHAEGNVRLTDSDGKITYANLLDLSDDYRDGFVDSLRLDTADSTRMAATRADRTNGDVTIFQNGVYTACAACKDNPRKPPLWQVKGARIIHNQTEKMLYFENASLEFFGQPIAYLPYFSTPDPTVKRKSGFLTPNSMSNTFTGFGVEMPYYFALAPDYDDSDAARHHAAGPACSGGIPPAHDRRLWKSGATASTRPIPARSPDCRATRRGAEASIRGPVRPERQVGVG